MREGTMTFEIGHLRFRPSLPAPPPAGPVEGRTAPPAAPTAAAAHFDVIPASPPEDLLAEVHAASRRAADLAAQNRELHFEVDEPSGRVVIEVRTLDGDVIKTIPPSRALA